MSKNPNYLGIMYYFIKNNKTKTLFDAFIKTQIIEPLKMHYKENFFFTKM